MTFKPIDPKRDEFRRYLERAGVIESITKIFVRLVREKPDNPLEYLKQNLGDSLHQVDSYNSLQAELAEARNEIQRLRGIIQEKNPELLIDEQQTQETTNVAQVAQQTFQEIALHGATNDVSTTDDEAAAGTIINGGADAQQTITDDGDNNVAIEATKQTDLNNEKILQEAVNNCHISKEEDEEKEEVAPSNTITQQSQTQSQQSQQPPPQQQQQQTVDNK